mgnify:CR=1 FL=1
MNSINRHVSADKRPEKRESLIPDDTEVSRVAEEDLDDRVSAHPDNDPTARWYRLGK